MHAPLFFVAALALLASPSQADEGFIVRLRIFKSYELTCADKVISKCYSTPPHAAR
jgi:hypothetical protein